MTAAADRYRRTAEARRNVVTAGASVYLATSEAEHTYAALAPITAQETREEADFEATARAERALAPPQAGISSVAYGTPEREVDSTANPGPDSGFGME